MGCWRQPYILSYSHLNLSSLIFNSTFASSACSSIGVRGEKLEVRYMLVNPVKRIKMKKIRYTTSNDIGERGNLSLLTSHPSPLKS